MHDISISGLITTFVYVFAIALAFFLRNSITKAIRRGIIIGFLILLITILVIVKMKGFHYFDSLIAGVFQRLKEFISLKLQ